MKRFLKYLGIGYLSSVAGLWLLRVPSAVIGSDPFAGLGSELIFLAHCASLALFFGAAPLIVNSLVLTLLEKKNVPAVRRNSKR